MKYSIIFTPRARDNFKIMRKSDQQKIVDGIETQLRHQPDRVTRNRKKLEENPLAPWELRLGDFRVFYDIHEENQVVLIVAVGKKVHNRLFIGGEEISL